MIFLQKILVPIPLLKKEAKNGINFFEWSK